jgi:hypothetical protein
MIWWNDKPAPMNPDFGSPNEMGPMELFRRERMADGRLPRAVLHNNQKGARTQRALETSGPHAPVARTR